VFLALKIINFKNMYLAKSYSFFCYWSMDTLYINDIDQDIVKSNYIQHIIINWVCKMKKLTKLTNTRVQCVKCSPWNWL
jgi:hypothetical protein